MTIPYPAFSMVVGGVGFQVYVPHETRLALLAPLYSEFPPDFEPE
jgi:hypothetical protein